MRAKIYYMAIVAVLSFGILFAEEKHTSIFAVERYVPTQKEIKKEQNEKVPVNPSAIPPAATKLLFILDHSASMIPSQLRLRNNELKKALHQLTPETAYQIMFFGPGVVFVEPDWKAVHREPALDFVVTDPSQRKFTFIQYRGVNDWRFDGKSQNMPKSNWRNATRENITNSLSALGNFSLFIGTDWGIALEAGHRMDPPPDVIFFMSDGSGGNDPEPILENNRKHGSPIINTFAMQSVAGARQFFEIAKGTGGEFVIIDENGKAVKVTDPQKLEF